MPIYRQSISIFHQKSMKKGPNLLKKSIFLPKMSLSISIFSKMNLSISISIFSRMSLSILIFYWYWYFLKCPCRYRYRYRYRYFPKSPEMPYRYRYFLKVSIYRQSISIYRTGLCERERDWPIRLLASCSQLRARARERLAHKALGLLLYNTVLVISNSV